MGYSCYVNQREETLTYYQTLTTIHHLNHLLGNPSLTKQQTQNLITQREKLNLSLKK